MRKFINIFENVSLFNDEDDTEMDHREQEASDRVRRIEQAVEKFCAQECGFSFGNRSYQVNYDDSFNELSITPDDEEATLEQLMKLRVMGEVSVNASSAYVLRITIKTSKGFNITPAGK